MLRNIMRTPLVAALFGLSLFACAGQIDGGGGGGGGGGDDVVPGPDCGDTVVNAGEGCDDGNTVSGDGCSSTCQVEATPRLDVSVDKPTITTDLMSINMVTVTLTGSDGFSGPVSLTSSLVDATQTPITAWTVVLDKTTVDVPLNGTATAVATLTIPSDANVLAGAIKFVATSGAGVGTFETASNVTALRQVSFTMKLNADGQCVYPAASTTKLAIGTKVRWVNGEAAGSGNRITIHVDPDNNGVKHQPDPGSLPGEVYEQTIGGTPAGSFAWYCHAPGPDPGGILRLQAVQ
jgi:cysteine-rich repeat protein